MFATYYNLVQARGRRSEDSEIDHLRRLADRVIFPRYEAKIHFAALSLNGRGATSWGSCCLTLTDEFIEDRSTVFEENCVFFCKNNLSGFGDTIDPCFRATWGDRHVLAAAKLGGRLMPSHTEADFAAILFRPSTAQYSEEFIEVHIYGDIHRRAVARLVIVRQPLRDADKTILDDLVEALGQEEEVDIPVEMD